MQSRFSMICLVILMALVAAANAVWAKDANVPAPDSAKAPARTKVAILVFPGVELLDFAGPGEVFAACSDYDGKDLFEVYTVGLSKNTVQSMQFLTITPTFDPSDAPTPDIIVLPGGNVIPVMDDSTMLAWIDRQANAKCLLLSVCNGASVLAKLGRLDGLQVTTHHGNMDILQLLAPKVICLRDRRFIDNGNVITTAGISAGIDGALYVVAKLKGIAAAQRTATAMEFDYWYGFPSQRIEKPETDTKGVISQRGRIHQGREWAVMTLLMKIRNEGVEAALAQYPKMLASTTGHDKEMIEETMMDENAWWLLENSRDHEVGLAVLRFITAAYPQSSKAQQRLGQAYLQTGKKAEARKSLKRAVEIDPANQEAQLALKRSE